MHKNYLLVINILKTKIMKKALLMTGCAILFSLSIVFVGCKKKNNDDNGGGNNIVTENHYKVDDATYRILKDAEYMVYEFIFDTSTLITFISEGTILNPINAIGIAFPDNKIPIGTFEIDGFDYLGVVYLNSQEGDLISGTITVSQTNNKYTVTLSNGIAIMPDDTQHVISLNYTGSVELYNPSPTTNYFTIAGEKYSILLGKISTKSENGLEMTAVTFLEGPTSLNLLIITFLGSSIQEGTYHFSLSAGYPLGIINAQGIFIYPFNSGTLTVDVLGNNNYIFEINDGWVLNGTSGDMLPATCYFIGSLDESN